VPSTVLRFCYAFFSLRKVSHLEKTRIYKGKTMSHLEISSKKLKVVQTVIRLFTTNGFHTAGVDLIVKESEVTK
jgi:hypothetical protein